MGEKLIEIHKDFRFFIVTNLDNPHFSPEVCVKV